MVASFKLPNFSLENVVPITHEQNIICSKTRLDVTTHEQTIICRQLFAGHVVGSRPMERKEKINRMIMRIARFSCGFFTAMAGNKEPGLFYVLFIVS